MRYPASRRFTWFVVSLVRKVILMRQFTQSLVNFLKNEDGPTAVEYAVMLALIIVVCITAITALGTNANKTFSSVASTIGSTGSGS
jgi:pilus assembly protein Flp/PilA